MLVRYKRNKQAVCYDSVNLVTVGKLQAEEHPHGPFPSCGSCPYPSHGFICYNSEGDCLKDEQWQPKNRYHITGIWHAEAKAMIFN